MNRKSPLLIGGSFLFNGTLPPNTPIVFTDTATGRTQTISFDGTNIRLTMSAGASGIVATAGLTLTGSAGVALTLNNPGAAFNAQFFPLKTTVAGLPAGTEGGIAYATNGRKVGEGVGAGTGVPVYFSNGSWRVFSTDAAVAA